ncbi:MAG: hypothetical protein WD768_09780 [Phycisphaeraceae bacterium]
MRDQIDEPGEFTDEQLRAALREMGEKAQAKTFAAGRPVMVAWNGDLVLLFPDGTEKVVGTVAEGVARE